MHKRLFLALAAAAAFACSAANGETYPARPVRLVVPFAAGGSIDAVARLVAPRLAEELKAPVVVDNRPGADSQVGTQLVARAEPDGYTVLFGSLAVILNKSLYRKLPYDPLKDFQFVTPVASTPLFIVANPALGARNLREMAALQKTRGKAYDFGSGSSLTTLAGLLIASKAGMDVVYVPYKGSAPALAGVMSGEISFVIDSLQASKPLIDSGRVKALAVTANQRSAALPDVPALPEAGIEDAEVTSWWGVMLPARTPAAVVNRLHAGFETVMAQPDIVQRLASLGARPMRMTPPEFDAFAHKEFERYDAIVKAHQLEVN